MKSTILLAEDEADLRSALAITLTQAGYVVVPVDDGVKAMEVFARMKIDLAVIDLIMPEQEGVETIVKIRRNYPGVPIVAMSGGGSGDARDYLKIARVVGANVLLAKPFRLEELIDAVTGLCPVMD